MTLLLEQVAANVHDHSYRKELDHFHPAITRKRLGKNCIPKYYDIIQMKIATKHETDPLQKKPETHVRVYNFMLGARLTAAVQQHIFGDAHRVRDLLHAESRGRFYRTRATRAAVGCRRRRMVDCVRGRLRQLIVNENLKQQLCGARYL